MEGAEALDGWPRGGVSQQQQACFAIGERREAAIRDLSACKAGRRGCIVRRAMGARTETPIAQRGLTRREEAFCVAYVTDAATKGNGAASARKVGYAEATAKTAGTKLLRRPAIAARVAELRAQAEDATSATPENVTEQLRRIAMGDPTSLLTLDEARTKDPANPVFRWKRPDELTDVERGLVIDVDVTERVVGSGAAARVEQRFKYKLANRKEALDALARINGQFRDRVEHEHTHKVRALFEFVARTPETSETVAILNAKRRARSGTQVGTRGVTLEHAPTTDQHVARSTSPARTVGNG